MAKKKQLHELESCHGCQIYISDLGFLCIKQEQFFGGEQMVVIAPDRKEAFRTILNNILDAK